MQLTRFINPDRPREHGPQSLQGNPASGTPELGNPGENGFGELNQGYLEMSNVKVVEEMVNLILAQRAYEVNSKAVQAADEMMQQGNNLQTLMSAISNLFCSACVVAGVPGRLDAWPAAPATRRPPPRDAHRPGHECAGRRPPRRPFDEDELRDLLTATLNQRRRSDDARMGTAPDPAVDDRDTCPEGTADAWKFLNLLSTASPPPASCDLNCAPAGKSSAPGRSPVQARLWREVLVAHPRSSAANS